MALTPEYRTYLEDLFACIGPIRFKRAFGLDAMMSHDVMVGFALDERLYLRTDAQSRPAYEAEGCEPFTFGTRKGEVVTSYLTLPDRLFDDPDELAIWARRALEAALQTPTAVKKRAKKRREADAATKPSRKSRTKKVPAKKKTRK